jgi:hypothetical protein
MSTLTDGMTQFKEQQINNIVEQYQVAGTEQYCKEQLNKIIAVIDYIQNIDSDALPPVDLNVVISDIHTWCEGTLPTFSQEQQTQPFVGHTQELLDLVEDFNTTAEEKKDAGQADAYFDYTRMKLKYMQWLQNIFDVPSIDDHGMRYNKKDNASSVQMLLQEDTEFNKILKKVGVKILWLDENYFEQSFHALPALFNDMHVFYHAILDKLSGSRESTPETQPMSIEESSLEDPKFAQRLQMKSWLHQLEHIFSDEST